MNASSDTWRLMDRKFSREWRRGKAYRLTELRHLARKRGCTLNKISNERLDILSGSEVVARFQLSPSS